MPGKMKTKGKAYANAKLVNAKTLSKKNPDACAKLRDGSMRPDELAKQVAELSLKVSKLPTNPIFQMKHNPEVTANIIEAFDMVLINLLFNNQTEDDGYKFYEEFIRAEYHFQSKLSELLITKKNEIGLEELGTKAIGASQKAFEQVTVRWIQTNRLPHCSPRSMKKNLFYKVSTLEFSENLFRSISSNLKLEGEGVDQIREDIKNGEEINKVYHDAKRAATGVVEGEDKIRNTCWQCDRSASEGVFFSACSQCS